MAVDTQEIPSAAPTPALQPVTGIALEDIVIFDLDTTGLDSDCQITQITTCRLGSPLSTFSQYVLPNVPISKEATKVTKLSIGRASGHSILLLDGTEVSYSGNTLWPILCVIASRTISSYHLVLQVCLVYHNVKCNFLPFPSMLQVPSLPWAETEERFRIWLGDKAPCLLLAHNCLSFDATVLSRMVSNELLTLVSGFADSLPALRELLPERKGL